MYAVCAESSKGKIPEEFGIMGDFYFVTHFLFSTTSMYYNQKKNVNCKSSWFFPVVNEEGIGTD